MINVLWYTSSDVIHVPLSVTIISWEMPQCYNSSLTSENCKEPYTHNSLFITLRSVNKFCPTKCTRNRRKKLRVYSLIFLPSCSFMQRSSRKKWSRQRQIEQTNFTLGNTIQIVEESEMTQCVTLKTDRFRCVCTVRCSPRIGGGWPHQEKGTMHEGHRRVSIIVDNSAGCIPSVLWL